MEVQIYDYDRKIGNTERAIQASNLTENTKQVLQNYKVDSLLADNVGKSRCLKRLQLLFHFARVLGKDLSEATEYDVKRAIGELEQRKVSDWTKQDYRVIVRRFCKWLRKSKVYPPEVEWISLKTIRSHRRPEDLLTPEEVKSMIDHSYNPMERAFVSILYETGAKISELLTLQVKHLTQENIGFSFTVTGKTGMRRIRPNS